MGYPDVLIWLAVPAYIILQFLVIWRSSGPSRWVAALPLLALIPIGVITVIGIAQSSNLWPLLLLLASPVALIYVVVVGLFMWTAGKKSPPVT